VAGAPATAGDPRNQLLKEILAEDTPTQAAPVQATAANGPTRTTPEQAASPQATAATPKPLEGVGAAVASVPTWPIIALMVVLGGILWWFRGRKSIRNRPTIIQKLAAVPLGGRRSIALVDVLGHKLVLGLSEKGMSLLARIDDDRLAGLGLEGEEPAGAAPEPSEDFATLLNAADQGDTGAAEPAANEQRELARKFRSFRSA
jgi:flagellar biogenesis protein FliO